MGKESHVSRSRAKKKLRAAEEDKASSEPLSKRQELNNHIVCMRNTVQRVRIQIINRLIHQINRYKDRKGGGKQLEKGKRRAERLVEEIHTLKKIKKDKATLYALRDTGKLEDVLSRVDASLEEKALARISHHPLIQRDVKQYRDANPNWDMQIPVLLRMSVEKRKQKKEKQGEGESGGVVTAAARKLEKEEESSASDSLSNEERSETESYNQSSDDEDDSEADSEDDKQELVTHKISTSGRTIPGKKTSQKPVVAKTHSPPAVVDKSEGSVKVKFLTDLAELEDDSESLESKRQSPLDTAQGPVAKRPKSSFFVGGVDKPELKTNKTVESWRGPKKQLHSNAHLNPSKPVYRKGKLISKAPVQWQKGPPRASRRSSRFEGQAEAAKATDWGSKKISSDKLLKPAYVKAAAHEQTPSAESSEKLHPSWAAKKKQQQISLTAFQGKKITFDDDD